MTEKISIYHNPRCQKSREALLELELAVPDFEVIEYLKHSPTPSQIKTLCDKLGILPSTLVRKREAVYKENFKDEKISETKWTEILSVNPILIERPIVVKGKSAIVARTPGVLTEFLK